MLRQAAQRLAQQQGQQGEGETGDQSQPREQEGQQAEGDENQGEQRDTIADALLDKERAEREARERTRAVLGRIVPVEKDW
jgi:hypothetical protein